MQVIGPYGRAYAPSRHLQDTLYPKPETIIQGDVRSGRGIGNNLLGRTIHPKPQTLNPKPESRELVSAAVRWGELYTRNYTLNP
jgi:hypothetical protein